MITTSLHDIIVLEINFEDINLFMIIWWEILSPKIKNLKTVFINEFFTDVDYQKKKESDYQKKE